MKSGFVIFALLIRLPVTAPHGQASPGSQVYMLRPGVSVQKEIAGSEVHTYAIQIAAGQYLRVAIDPRGAVLNVRLIAPGNVRMLEVLTPRAPLDPARVSLIAQSAGQYLIELSPARNDAPSKQYAIRIEDLRAASSADQDRVAAERLCVEAGSLLAAVSGDALRAASEKYRAALDIWQEIGGQGEEAQTLLILGSISHNLSHPADALNYYNQSLPIWRSLGERSKEAQTLSALGWTYFSIGDLHKALENYNQALPLRRALGDLRGQAQTLATIGQVYKSLGEPQRAMDHYSQALPLAREAGDKVQEAFALNNFAYLFAELGEHQKALDYVAEALPLYREMGNGYGEADTLNAAGSIYEELGDFEKALEHLDQSLKIWRHVGNKLGEADVLNNLGIAYMYMGQLQGSPEQLQKAVDFLNQALALRRTTGQLLGDGDTLINLGLAYEYLGQRDKALDYFNQVLASDPGSPTALNNIGLNYFFRGNYNRALEYCSRALLIFRERANKNGEAQSLRAIAAAQSNIGNLSEALSDGRTALGIIESLRAKVAGPEVRTAYQGMIRDYYVLLIDILTKLHQLHPSEGYDAAALEISERARARGLLDLLVEARIDIRKDVEPSLLDHERTLQRQLNAKEQYRMRLLANKPSEAERTTVENEIASLVSEYQEIRARVRASSPKYAALTQPTTLSLKQIQQTLLDEDTVLLEYCLGQSRSFLWAVTSTSVSSYMLPDRTQIEAAARRIYDLLTARNNHAEGETPELRVNRVRKADAEFRVVAEGLSQILLAPVAVSLGKKRLVFVTEGLLQYIPFAALPAPRRADAAKGRRDASVRLDEPLRVSVPPNLGVGFTPLLVDHEIVNLPSASVLAVLRREVTGRKRPANSVAVIADPVFSRDDPRIKFRPALTASISLRPNRGSNGLRIEPPENQSRTSGFGRLRFSREEADNIVALAPRATSLKAVDFAASRDTVSTANLDQYRILHFATHGMLNSKRPELSGLVLSLVDQKGQPQDGFLGLDEIYNLRLNADLVVLSACQSALGKESKGEGLVGLTRGFMYAGAPRVVASLWSVDDRATTELMKRFYQAMLMDGMRPAAALRAAQTSLLAEKGWSAPYYWGAFTLQGEWK